jgi:hypothetical protein
LGGGKRLGGVVNMGEILLSLRDAMDLVMLFLDLLIGLTDRFNVDDFSLDKESILLNIYR